MSLDNFTKKSPGSSTSLENKYLPKGSFVYIPAGTGGYPAIILENERVEDMQIMPLDFGFLKWVSKQMAIDSYTKDTAEYITKKIKYNGNGNIIRYKPQEKDVQIIRDWVNTHTKDDMRKYIIEKLYYAQILNKLPSHPTRKLDKSKILNQHRDKVILSELELEKIENEYKQFQLNGQNTTEDDLASEKTIIINESDTTIEQVEKEIELDEQEKQKKEKEESNKTEQLETIQKREQEKEERKKKIKEKIKKQIEIQGHLDQWKYFKNKNVEKNIESEFSDKVPLLSENEKAIIARKSRQEAEVDERKEREQNYYFINHTQEILRYFSESKIIKMFFDEEFKTVEQACIKIANLNWDSQQSQINYVKKQVNKLSWIKNWDQELMTIFEGKKIGEFSDISNKMIANHLRKYISGKYSSQEAIDYWNREKNNLIEKIKSDEYNQKKKKMIADRDFEIRVIEQGAEVNKEIKKMEYDKKLRDLDKEQPKKSGWLQKAVGGVKSFFKW